MTKPEELPAMSFEELSATLLSLDRVEDGDAQPPASADDDLSWLGEIVPVRKDPRVEILREALDEFRKGPPGVFLRPALVAGRRFVIIGTWKGERDGQAVCVFASAGHDRSVIRSAYVELDDREAGAEEHRVWLLRHEPGLPVRFWASRNGRTQGARCFVLDEQSWRAVSNADYESALRGWS